MAKNSLPVHTSLISRLGAAVGASPRRRAEQSCRRRRTCRVVGVRVSQAPRRRDAVGATPSARRRRRNAVGATLESNVGAHAAAGGRITGRSFFFRGHSRFFFGFFFAPSSVTFFFFFFFGFLAVMPALRNTEPCAFR